LIDKNSFTYGINKDELKECPFCHEISCYYLGVQDIECANKNCKFYKRYTSSRRTNFDCDKKYKQDFDEEKIEKKNNEKKENVNDDFDGWL